MIQNARQVKSFADGVVSQVGETMFDVEEVTRLCVIALYTGGHVLLEGNPGLGKTELVKAMSKVLGLPFNRIQFTPDLMPQDITGTLMPSIKDGATQLDFQPGPIFTSLLLADEINRATPKTQSAMLEAMAEKQVTVLGTQYKLYKFDFRYDEQNPPIKHRPFMVLATQNPIDHDGTYALPEAQSDRFMFKILMPIPQATTIEAILRKTTQPQGDENDDEVVVSDGQSQKQAVAKFRLLQKSIKQVALIPMMQHHILNMVLASNKQYDALRGITDRRQLEQLKKLAGLMVYGLGPRAAISLMNAAKAYTLLFYGDENASSVSLAQVAIPTLRHRLHLKYNWRNYFSDADEIETEVLRDRLIREFVVAAAPTQHGEEKKQRDIVAQRLDQLLARRPY